MLIDRFDKRISGGGITMDIREKLVELIAETIELYPSEREELADGLIANGVTVQEWISVKDRLPEDDSDVLAYSSIEEESRIYPACYSNGVWFDCVFNAPATDTTTHWMPMPNPPKGAYK